MSTLSGTASKGEKTKPKFQSLDINSVFKSSRGENTEKPVQKTSSIYIKHGMQTLGKVPNARRAPANLPSLKSEHSGSDAAVPLVPPGATGWGSKGESTPTSGGPQHPSSHPQQNGSAGPQPSQQSHAGSAPHHQPPQLTPHQQAIALPVTNTIPPQHKQQTQVAQAATPSGGDKLWSTVMAGGNQDGHPPIYQSPQFQHEFPSLSSGDGGVQAPGRNTDGAQYGAGLSLRPQTEGSWTQGGGQRPPASGTGPDSMRPGSGPPGAPPQLQGLVGPPRPESFPPQMRGVMPPFMYKGSYPSGTQMGSSSNQHPMTSQMQHHQSNRRPNDNRPPRMQDRDNRDRDRDRDGLMEREELTLRPIIKEEELSKLDDIGSDVGWAVSDDIDYNQKLAFSDDEADVRQPKREAKSVANQQHQHSRNEKSAPAHNQQDSSRNVERQTPNRHWNNNQNNQQHQNNQRNSGSRGRNSDEEDAWSQRQKQHNKEVNMAIERAKQRKKEEEKRFNEEKRRAAKKLQELDEKMAQKRDRDRESEEGTINPSSVPPKPINHVEIPLPDFQKEKERDNRDSRDSRSKTPSDTSKDDNRQENSFRQLTQIEGKSFPIRNKSQQAPNKPDHRRDGASEREQNGPNFSRQFQHDLPPRFMKNRSGSGSSGGGQQQYYESNNRNWSSNQNSKSRGDAHSPEREHDDRKDYMRQVSEDSYRSSHSQDNYGKSPDNRHSDENLHRRHASNDEDKWHRGGEREKERKYSDYDRYDDRRSQEKLSDRDRQSERDRLSDRDRPQRPDSRDSHASHTSHGSHGSHSSSNRRSRDLDVKETMGSWNEVMELAYEEKRLSYEDNRLTYEEKRGSYEEKRESRVKEEPREAREPHPKRSGSALVPGPITRERLEAEDLNSEKRSLTQLKKGEPPLQPKKPEPKKSENTEKMGSWADALPPTEEPEPKTTEHKEPVERTLQEPVKKQHDDAAVGHRGQTQQHHQSGNRGQQNRGYSQKSWGSWGGPKRPQRGHRSGGPGRDYYGHTTDSDDTETFSMDHKDSGKRKPQEKDEKNRENKQEKSASGDKKSSDHKRDGYIPKGEPTRHGRGGGSNFRGTRMGGLGKRIDGYGPPPSKSPFGNQSHDEKDKKIPEESKSTNTTTTTSEPAPVPDKTKQNQEALAAGIFGKSRQDSTKDNKETKTDQKKSLDANNKTKSKENENSSDQKDNKNSAKTFSSGKPPQQHTRDNKDQRGLPSRGRNAPPPRMGDKRHENPQNQSATKKPDPKLEAQNILASAIADISLKNKDSDEKSEKNESSADSEGFQEVKSKKTGAKEKQKVEEVKKVPLKDEKKEVKVENKKPGGPISKPTNAPESAKNIPSLMATPVQPPPSMLSANKGPPFGNAGGRPNDRTAKLAPRFAKQKMQKQAMQQHILGSDEMGKMTQQNVYSYGLKESPQQPISQPPPCAWDKPLTSQFKTTMESEPNAPTTPNMLGLQMDGIKLDGTPSPGHGASPSADKILGKSPQLQDKAHLDGATPPVNTIIFENTNFKSAPGSRSGPRGPPGVMPGAAKPNTKLEDTMDSNMFSGKAINDLLQKSDGKNDPIQLPVFKEDTSDMKLDFFGSDLSHLTDDKMPVKSLSAAVKSSTTVSSTICNADSLNMKIASVKKVWETSEQENEDNSGITFGAPVLDSSMFKNEPQDDNHEGFSPGQSQNVSTGPNVCKVKPTQQVTGSTGQSIAPGQQPPSMAQAALLGIPLSPPPMAAAPLIGAGVGLGPQQYTAAQQHIGYQPSAHAPNNTGSAQYGLSTIPSPPAVLYNSTQLQAAAAQSAGLYGAFLPPTADQSVLGGQGRSQFSQYPSYPSLGQPASSPYNAQSVYLQTAHPPPTAQAPPELYSNLNSYRLSATNPFGQSQQLNNPTTVLISSTSNSSMSASVKPSNNPISAIGTKAGGVGQAYQQQSQQGQPMYMAYDPAIQAAANYLPNANVLQRGPGAPVQNNVMPTLQPSSSYYSGSTGGQPSYFQQPGSSTLQSATQLSQHQGGYGLQGNVFGAPGQSHNSTGLQDLFGYNSHLFSTPMQMAAAISAQAQQYLKQHQQQPQQQQSSQQQNPYMKTVGSSQMGGSDQMNSGNRPQQLKSPSSQEALSSVFNSSPQIPSPKSKPPNKHNSQSSSPTSQRKYNFYQGVNQQSNIQQRYPTPIQRPVNFQQQQQVLNAMGGQNVVMGNQNKHNPKPNTGKPPTRQYYGGQNNPLSASQPDKSDVPKVTDPSAVKSATVDMKDTSKEDTATLKD